jgi:hypothetical protein
VDPDQALKMNADPDPGQTKKTTKNKVTLKHFFTNYIAFFKPFYA